jgi:hypothetical protein
VRQRHAESAAPTHVHPMPVVLAIPCDFLQRPVRSIIPPSLPWRDELLVRGHASLPEAATHLLERATSIELSWLLKRVSARISPATDFSLEVLLRPCVMQLKDDQARGSRVSTELFSLVASVAAVASVDAVSAVSALGACRLGKHLLDAVGPGGWTAAGSRSLGGLLLGSLLCAPHTAVPQAASEPQIPPVGAIEFLSIAASLAPELPRSVWLRTSLALEARAPWRTLTIASRTWQFACSLRPGGLGVLLLHSSSFTGGMVVAVRPDAHVRTRQVLAVGDIVTRINGEAVDRSNAQRLLECLPQGEVSIDVQCRVGVTDDAGDDAEEGAAGQPVDECVEQAAVITQTLVVVAVAGLQQPTRVAVEDADQLRELLEQSQAEFIARAKFVCHTRSTQTRKEFAVCWAFSNPRAEKSLNVRTDPARCRLRVGGSGNDDTSGGAVPRVRLSLRIRPPRCEVQPGMPQLPGLIAKLIALAVPPGCIATGEGTCECFCVGCSEQHEYVRISTVPDYSLTAIAVRERLHEAVLVPRRRAHGHVSHLRQAIARAIRRALGLGQISLGAKLLPVDAPAIEVGAAFSVDGATVDGKMLNFGLTLTNLIGATRQLLVPGFTPFISFGKARIKEEEIFSCRNVFVDELATATNKPYQIGRVRFVLKLVADGSDHKAQAILKCLEANSCAYRSEALLLPVGGKFNVALRDDVFFRGGPKDVGLAIGVALWWYGSVTAHHVRLHGQVGAAALSELRSQLRELFAGLDFHSVVTGRRPLLDSPQLDTSLMVDVIKLLHDGEKGVVPRVHWILMEVAGLPDESARLPGTKELLSVRPRTKQLGQTAVKKKHALAVGKEFGDGLNGRNWSTSVKLFRTIYEDHVPALALQMPQLLDIVLRVGYSSRQSLGGWLIMQYAVRPAATPRGFCVAPRVRCAVCHLTSIRNARHGRSRPAQPSTSTIDSCTSPT